MASPSSSLFRWLVWFFLRANTFAWSHTLSDDKGGHRIPPEIKKNPTHRCFSTGSISVLYPTLYPLFIYVILVVYTVCCLCSLQNKPLWRVQHLPCLLWLVFYYFITNALLGPADTSLRLGRRSTEQDTQGEKKESNPLRGPEVVV